MSKAQKSDLVAVLRKMRNMLEAESGGALTSLGKISRTEDPFKVLISTILSARTRDNQTEIASKRLFKVYANPKALAHASEEKVRELIRPVGFYNVKTRRVIEVSRILLKRFNGIVPDNMDALLTLPGVGRKTANCILVYGFGTPAIPVDTHVHRIPNRLGLAETKTPEDTEKALAKIAPKKHWLEINELFVRFGKTICLPIGPRCPVCTLKTHCKHYLNFVQPKGKTSR